MGTLGQEHPEEPRQFDWDRVVGDDDYFRFEQPGTVDPRDGRGTQKWLNDDEPTPQLNIATDDGRGKTVDRRTKTAAKAARANNVQVGDYVLIRYIGDLKLAGGRSVKDFDVKKSKPPGSRRRLRSRTRRTRRLRRRRGLPAPGEHTAKRHPTKSGPVVGVGTGPLHRPQRARAPLRHVPQAGAKMHPGCSAHYHPTYGGRLNRAYGPEVDQRQQVGCPP